MQVERVTPYLWRIPPEAKAGMRVPGLVYADDELMAAIRRDGSLEQVANGATLPGIVKASLAMPDIHQGYGLPVGGVVATDAARGVVSPGGVGYDINCLAGESRLLSPDGWFRPIESVIDPAGEAVVTLFDGARMTRADVIAHTARQPRRQVLELVTSSGRRLVATADHPLLSPDGWRQIGQLQAGDRVAVSSFEGVPYERPAPVLLVTPEALEAEDPRGVESLRNRGLLPLTLDHPAAPVLLKVFGYAMGDGSLHFDRHRSVFVVSVNGKPEDLERMREELASWTHPSRIYVRERSCAMRGKNFRGKDIALRLRSPGFGLLLKALGMPVGRKTIQDWRVPEWIRHAPLWMKRLFLAGFFGAELSAPSVFERAPKNFQCPILTVVKREGFVESGRQFLQDVADMLAAFGVRTLKVMERREQLNPDGRRSIMLRLVISNESASLLALWGRVGYEYNTVRMRSGSYACGYLRSKEAALRTRRAMVDEITERRARSRCGAKRILGALGTSVANLRFVERTIYSGRRTSVRTRFESPDFRTWLSASTVGLGESGLVWDEVEAKTPRSDVQQVYDITVAHPGHNFVANGFVVHNCGVRLVRTNLTGEDLGPRLAALVDALAQAIPSGVGSRGRLPLDPREERHGPVARGARWAVERGLGEADDLGRIESHGEIPGADPEAVSRKAYERGRAQMGTLGSGNHFLEIQAVDEVAAPDVASVLGLEPGRVTVMIHTGSRGLGHQVCTDALAAMQPAMRRHGITLPDRQLACAPTDSPEARAYLGAMRAAANFAFANRQCLSHFTREVFERVLGLAPRDLGFALVYDVAHNIAKEEEHEHAGRRLRLLVHRKGATRAFPPGHPELPPAYRAIGQPVLIPGDMGRYSYVLVGAPGSMRETFGSTCHGAGRVLSRTAAVKAARGRSIADELRAQGVLVRASGRDSLAEEMPDAYKDVKKVVDVVERAGLSRVVARLRPLAVVKG
ncbi:MAG: RtcB family protein [Candidatus Rokuibacteriota bacterium]